MRIRDSVKATVDVEEIKIEEGHLVLRGSLQVGFEMPAQDEHLYQQMEAAIDVGGQQLKQQLFAQAIERADLELVIEQRQGKGGEGIERRGYAPYTFKTVFGTVGVERSRIYHKADGSSEIPSAHAWQTPQQICITQGLRDAVCDALVAESTNATLQALEARTGEDGVLGRSTVLKLVHEEGEELQAAQQQRAEAIWTAHPQAQERLLPSGILGSGSVAEEEAQPEVEANAEAQEEAALAHSPPLGFPGSRQEAQAVAEDQPRQIDVDCVIVEADEVKVHAQPHTGRKELWVYTGMVMTAQARYHFSAKSAASLWWQLGSLLVLLGVHLGHKQLLVLADGAKWIRAWYENLKLAGSAMILCWYHLVKRCEQQLSMACRGRAHRAEVQTQVLGYLWEGRVEQAIEVVESRMDEMKNEQAAKDLIEYLRNRQPYIPNYKERQAAGLWIASNRVEKWNDWAVSKRCKGLGMEWTEKGVNALAALQATRCNGELELWRETRQLPSWEVLMAA